jgi:lysylphosphatidylglycerol synthetase-like protein (DUF2156 family)
MRSWPALLLAPVLALADQSVAYALAPLACARQGVLLPHAVHFAFLAATVALTLLAWSASRATRDYRPDDAQSATRPFLALTATLTGALCTLVIVALWIPQWVLSPCYG